MATLLRQDRVEDAFCRASGDRDASLVVPAILAKVAPTWQLQRVLPEDLPGLEPALAKALFAKYAILVVQTRARAPAELTAFQLSNLRFVERDPARRSTFVPVNPPISVADFAVLFGEGVPEPKQVTETRLAHPERAIPWALLTLGFSLMFAERRTTTETRYPTQAELREVAPKSAALYDALVKRFGYAPLAVLARGDGEARLQVETRLILDNHDGRRAEDCGSRLVAHLHGAPFTLGEPERWPGGEGFQPFVLQPWGSVDFTDAHGDSAVVEPPKPPPPSSPGR